MCMIVECQNNPQYTQKKKKSMVHVIGVCVMHGMKTCVSGKTTFTTWGSRGHACPKWGDAWDTYLVVLMVRLLLMLYCAGTRFHSPPPHPPPNIIIIIMITTAMGLLDREESIASVSTTKTSTASLGRRESSTPLQHVQSLSKTVASVPYKIGEGVAHTLGALTLSHSGKHRRSASKQEDELE